jgi:uncharacterized membrane protein
VSGGTLNPIASTAEDGATLAAIGLAIFAPVLALVLSIVLVIVVVRYLARRRRRSAA